MLRPMREQINQNKADIAGLAEDMADLAPGIKITAAGTDISIKDAAEGRELRGLRVFGRAEQGENPSPDNPQEIEMCRRYWKISRWQFKVRIF